MFNVFLQMFIPLALTFVALLLIVILRKYFKAESIVLCAVTLLLAVGSGILGFSRLSAEKQAANAAAASRGNSSLSVSEQLLIAEQYAADGNLNEAKTLLDELKQSGETSAKVFLLSARIAALEGNWSTAAQRYTLAQSMNEKAFPEEELTVAGQLSGGAQQGGNQAMSAYLSSLGLRGEDYGINAVSVSLPDADQAQALVMEAISDSLAEQKELRSNSKLFDCAENASLLTAQFRSYLEHGSFDSEAVEQGLEELEDAMKGSDSYGAAKCLRTARLKGYILLQDYGAIAKFIDDNSEIEELIIVSELYIAGLINDSDFSRTYAKAGNASLQAVLAQAKQVLSSTLADAPKNVRTSYKEKVNILSELKELSVLGNLRQSLRDYASSTTGSMTSKTYLELAKIEQHLGNSSVADECITQAFGTLAYSEDEQYNEPMNALLGIIDGTSAGGTEDLKDIADFVAEAVDNSLPLDITPAGLTAGADTTGSTQDFTEHMTDTVSQKTAVINIGVIDKSAFPMVKARIQVNSSQIASVEDMKTYLQVYDCNSQITEFTVEKLEFSTSRIILLCDVSGSMSGNVSALKNAITRFAEEMNENEEISVIGFDDSINFEHGFSDDAAKVASYAEDIGAHGGTDMFSALEYAIGKFPSDINANNIVILLTDGEDNSPKGEATIRNEIGALCAANAATVYTLGLGSSVDTAYLTLLASAGNGSFLYVDSEESLDNFYDFIHQQLTSQYVLTYTAKNTTLNQRKLALSVSGELGSAEKIYYLEDPVYSDQSSDAYTPYVVEDTDVKLYGLTTRFIYRSSKDQTVLLKGEGFDSGDDITVKISGNVSYQLTASYVDASTYELLIPSNVAADCYDLEVSIRGDSFTMEDEFTVAVYGTEKVFTYGPYSFTALSSYQDASGHTVLSGNVVMNGWLFFKGEVTIVGDYQDSGHVTLRDSSGAYISYAENNSTGLAHTMAEKGMNLVFGPLGDFTIYIDSYNAGSYDSYPVEKIKLHGVLDVLFLLVETPSISIYPDCIAMEGLNFDYSFPFQKQLLRNFSKSFLEKSVDASTGALLSATDIGLVGEFHYSDLSDSKEPTFSMVSLPLRLTGLNVSVDTLSNNYTIGASVSFKTLKDMDSISLEFGVKKGRFDSISLETGGNKSVTIIKTPVPVKISDFGFALEGFSEYESDNSLLSNILGTTIAFKFQANVADVSSQLPGLKKFICGNDKDKELAAASLKDCTLSATLKTFSFKFEADIYLFTVLDFGKCEIEAGSFQYTNKLLNLNAETEYGLRAALTVGPTWDTTNCHVSATGTAELTVGYPYTGLWLNGKADFDVGWWILKADFDVSGDFLVAIFKNSSDQMQFSMIVRGTNASGSYSGFHLYITPTTGMDVHTY